MKKKNKEKVCVSGGQNVNEKGNFQVTYSSNWQNDTLR